VSLRDLIKKIDLKLRPLQLGDGQLALDEEDGLTKTNSAAATEAAPRPWEDDRPPE
jgi:hypothetical protein